MYVFYHQRKGHGFTTTLTEPYYYLSFKYVYMVKTIISIVINILFFDVTFGTFTV